MSQVNMFLWHIQDEGGRLLKDALGIQAILREGSSYRGSRDKVVINWGCSDLPRHVLGSQIINSVAAVATSVNKLRTFQAMEGQCNHVPFTTSRITATEWLMDGHRVVCRDKLTGRGGDGLRIIDATALNLPAQRDFNSLRGWIANLIGGPVRAPTALLEGARLFTRFVPYEREYRVHVVDGVAINVRRKIDISVDGVGDFRNVTIYPHQVAEEAIKATRAVGLDFAGVDVLWDGSQAWVLETNTAPGIGGITVSRYAVALRELIRRRCGASYAIDLAPGLTD